MDRGKYGTSAKCASNLSRSDRKNPGMTISPRPSNDISIFSVFGENAVQNPDVPVRGKSNLIGPSRDLATVTITSVPKLYERN